MLKLTDYEVFYGDFRAVRGLTLSLSGGEVLGLTGRNGAGKTSTLKGVLGLVRTEGKILFRGQDLREVPPHRRAELGIGYFPQERRVFKGLTVAENLKLVGDRAKRARIGQAAIDLFPELEIHLEQMAGKLSGGEQVMVAMARALLTDPELLLLDEPTEGLAPGITKKILKLLEQNVSAGNSVLIAEQNFDSLASVTSKIFFLERGRIVRRAISP